MKLKYLILVMGFFTWIFSCDSSDHAFIEENEEEDISDWFISQRIYPYGKVDYNAYREGIKIRASLIEQNTERQDLEWQLEGPVNTGGRIQDVEMNPDNTNIIFVGAASGGVWKSIDAGLNWKPVFDAHSSQSIGDIAIAPSDPSIMYVGTGEPNCGGGSITYDGMGIYKSVDSGETWNYSGLDSTRNTGRIVIDPKNPERIFVATMGDLFGNGPHRGVYRSTDGGSSWENILFSTDSTGAIDLAINPNHPDTIYACMWERIRRPTYEHYGGPSCGIFRSYDGGDTWIELTNGLPSGNNLGRIGIDISQSNPGTLYAIYADKIGYFTGIYKTQNNGDSWTQTNDAGLGGMFASYGWWFGRIKVDPLVPDIAFAIGFDIYRTTNGGLTWTNASGIMHVDHHSMFIHPLNNDIVYDGNDGGLYRSQNGGNSWSHFDNLPITQFYTSEIDNNNTQRIYGGTQDNNVIRTMTGAIDDWESIIGGDGFYVLVDPENSNYIYAESQYGALVRSTNGGSSFLGATNGIGINDRTNWNTPVVFNPQNTKSLYYGSNKLYKSLNRAINWSAISGDLTNGSGGGNITFGTLTTISVSPIDTNIIYVGTDDGNVWISPDNGANWINISTSLPDRWVTRVMCDPFDASRAYVTLSGYRFHDDMVHVYMTSNGGQSWVSIAGDLPDVPSSDIIVNPFVDSTLFVATDLGVFVTYNLGNTWNVLGNGLPPAPVTDLTFHAPTQTLLAATYGRSMYSIELSELTTIQTAISQSEFNVNVFPNPTPDILNIEVTLGHPVNLHMKLFNADGKIVSILEKQINSGTHYLQWDLKENSGDLPGGIYLLNISNGKDNLVKKIVVM